MLTSTPAVSAPAVSAPTPGLTITKNNNNLQIEFNDSPLPPVVLSGNSATDITALETALQSYIPTDIASRYKVQQTFLKIGNKAALPVLNVRNVFANRNDIASIQQMVDNLNTLDPKDNIEIQTYICRKFVDLLNDRKAVESFSDDFKNKKLLSTSPSPTLLQLITAFNTFKPLSKGRFFNGTEYETALSALSKALKDYLNDEITAQETNAMSTISTNTSPVNIFQVLNDVFTETFLTETYNSKKKPLNEELTKQLRAKNIISGGITKRRRSTNYRTRRQRRQSRRY